jgi:hypothetical protein
VCVFCGYAFPRSPEERARAVASAAAVDDVRRAAGSGRGHYEANSTEDAYDETEYYTWERGHMPWELPRASWFKYRGRDQFWYWVFLLAALGAGTTIRWYFS